MTTRQLFVRCNLVFLSLVVSTISSSAAAQTSARIATIEKLRRQVDEQIAQAEQNPEASTTFLTELSVNKNLSPYPAVGIYKTVVKFYYTFGDREKEPYPNRLLKIIIDTDRSDRKEHSEFVFDEAERLVFYFEKKDHNETGATNAVEQRLYFNSARAIKLMRGNDSIPLIAKTEIAFVNSVQKQKTELLAMFRRSLDF